MRLRVILPGERASGPAVRVALTSGSGPRAQAVETVQSLSRPSRRDRGWSSVPAARICAGGERGPCVPALSRCAGLRVDLAQHLSGVACQGGGSSDVTLAGLPRIPCWSNAAAPRTSLLFNQSKAMGSRRAAAARRRSAARFVAFGSHASRRRRARSSSMAPSHTRSLPEGAGCLAVMRLGGAVPAFYCFPLETCWSTFFFLRIFFFFFFFVFFFFF